MDQTTRYILEQTSSRAKELFPNDPSAQLHYQVGFLAAQLSLTWQRDSINIREFKSRIGPAANVAKRG
jgi:hypothetical protein